MGESTTFPGNSQHDSYFHGNQPKDARLYQHFAQSNLAYFMDRKVTMEEAKQLTLRDV